MLRYSAYIYILHNIAIKYILLSLACAFKKVILQSSNSIRFTSTLRFAYIVFMTLCRHKGMKIGNNSEHNAFPDIFFLFVNFSVLLFCIISRHFTAERINEKKQSYTIRGKLRHLRIKTAWVAAFPL